MKWVTGILALFSVILYATGFWICEYFYFDDIDKWRWLRDTLTGTSIFMLVLLQALPQTKVSKAAMWSLGIFCFGNLVDRLIFDIDQFVRSDYLVIGLAIAIFVYKLKGRDVQITR